MNFRSYTKSQAIVSRIAECDMGKKVIWTFVKEETKDCDICVKFGRSEAESAVIQRLSSDFNAIFAEHLHILRSFVYIKLHGLLSRNSRHMIIFSERTKYCTRSLSHGMDCPFLVDQSQL